MLSTLLRAGFTQGDLEGPELTQMLDILSRSFEVEKGVLGFGMSSGTTATLNEYQTDRHDSSFL